MRRRQILPVEALQGQEDIQSVNQVESHTVSQASYLNQPK